MKLSSQQGQTQAITQCKQMRCCRTCSLLMVHHHIWLPVPRFSPPCLKPVYYSCMNNPQELGFVSHSSSRCQIKSICGNFVNVSRWFRIICCFAKAPTLTQRKSTNRQTMSGYSHSEINDQPLCLSSHSYSFSQRWRNESSHFMESAVKTSDPSGPPAHFDSGTSWHNKPAPYLFMSVDTVEPPTITWYMRINLQVRVRSFSSSTPDTGCQKKQLPFGRNNSSVALLRVAVEGPGKVSHYCPPTDPGTYSCESNTGIAHTLLRPASQIARELRYVWLGAGSSSVYTEFQHTVLQALKKAEISWTLRGDHQHQVTCCKYWLSLVWNLVWTFHLCELTWHETCAHICLKIKISSAGPHTGLM